LAESSGVIRVREIAADAITALARRYSIDVVFLEDCASIDDSFWGAPEAGSSHAGLRLRPDTPVHSLLHELCHIVCMTPARRQSFERDAGGSDAEECGVCYLQVLLSDELPGFDGARCLADMDAWGYSFREGSAAAWFAGDGREAREWLREHALIDGDGAPTWKLRGVRV
jgi:hypothetical protein